MKITTFRAKHRCFCPHPGTGRKLQKQANRAKRRTQRQATRLLRQQ